MRVPDLRLAWGDSRPAPDGRRPCLRGLTPASRVPAALRRHSHRSHNFDAAQAHLISLSPSRCRMMRAMIRLTFAGLAFFACCGLAASPASAQASAGDLFVKVDQLENQVRQLTGMVEEERFRNQQLDAALKRMQDDYESRLQEPGAARRAAPAGAGRCPQSTLRAALRDPFLRLPRRDRPAGAPTHSIRRKIPPPPGAPRTLGSIYTIAPRRNRRRSRRSRQKRPARRTRRRRPARPRQHGDGNEPGAAYAGGGRQQPGTAAARADARLRGDRPAFAVAARHL